jgi:hypothetical protein
MAGMHSVSRNSERDHGKAVSNRDGVISTGEIIVRDAIRQALRNSERLPLRMRLSIKSQFQKSCRGDNHDTVEKRKIKLHETYY